MIITQEEFRDYGFNIPEYLLGLVIPLDRNEVFVQHQGTNLCGDFHCPCGYSEHVDQDFCFYWLCDECKTLYKVGSHIGLYKLGQKE